jgi:hypothetical protein
MQAEYGGARWADEQAQMQLAMSWMRRKQFEARVIAAEVNKLLVGGDDQQRMAGHELLGMAGISL